MDEAALRDRLAELTGHPAPGHPGIPTGTTLFMNIRREPVLLLEGCRYDIGGDFGRGGTGVHG